MTSGSTGREKSSRLRTERVVVSNSSGERSSKGMIFPLFDRTCTLTPCQGKYSTHPPGVQVLSWSDLVQDFSNCGGNSRVQLNTVFLRMVACGDGKGFFAVHVHFASPNERQNVHELQRRFKQRQSLCLN